MKVLRTIETVLNKWEVFLMWIGMAAILVCTFLITADVLLRNLFGKSIVGTTELVSLLLLPIFICALGAVQAKKGHVILEFATANASRLTKTILDAFGAFVGLFLFAAISGSCVTSAMLAFTRNDRGSGVIAFPIWPFKLLLAVVVISMAIRLALDLALYLCDIHSILTDKRVEKELT